MTPSKLFFLAFVLLLAPDGYAQQWGEYTLVSLQNSTSTQLLDTNGNTYKTWTNTGKTGYSSYMMPGGFLWRAVSKTGNSFTGGPICGQVQKVDFAGNIVWDFIYSTTNYCTHHDICPMPNGNVLLIAYERKTANEVTTAGGTSSIEMWPEKIVEIKPTGATTGDVVWEWKAWDHLMQSTNSAKSNYVNSLVQHPELFNINYKQTKDWMHMNGVDYNPILDQIAMSSHNLNEWYIIDHSTTTAEAASHTGGNSGKGGDILYRWGNPAAYGASGTAILNVTHDAHWIPEGAPNAGRLAGFNNKGVSATKSSVDQALPTLNGYNYDITLGTAFLPVTYNERHACSGYSSNMGSSQQLPNGNMLVCVATAGLVYEIDPSGTTIWTKTFTGSVPQSFRYSECFINNTAPAIPEISSTNNILTSTAANTYQWYRNGQLISGANSITYQPKSSGIYLVRITDNNGCVNQYSKGFKFNLASPSLTVMAEVNTSVICSGNSIQLDVTVTGDSGTSVYSWTSEPPGFYASNKSPKVNPVITTTYKVVVTNNGNKDSSEVLVTVNPKPAKPVITRTGNALYATSGNAYKWFEDTLHLPAFTSSSYSPAKSGLYRVKITDSKGCESDYSDAFSFTVSILPISTVSYKFALFPNPSFGMFTIENRSLERNVEVEIYDLFGKLIHVSTVLEDIDLSEKNSGIYFVKILANKHLVGALKLNLIK